MNIYNKRINIINFDNNNKIENDIKLSNTNIY